MPEGLAIITVIFCLPFTPAAVPGRDEFDAKFVNYAPIMVGLILLIVGIWWIVSARKYFTGSSRTVDLEEAGLAPEA